jgi:hypothetical protein
MSKSTEDVIEEVRLQLQGITELLHELDEYLRQFQAATAMSPTPAATTADSRQPYLAGRQPRRDGDSYATVAASTVGGAHGHDQAGSLRPSERGRG